MSPASGRLLDCNEMLSVWLCVEYWFIVSFAKTLRTGNFSFWLTSWVLSRFSCRLSKFVSALPDEAERPNRAVTKPTHNIIKLSCFKNCLIQWLWSMTDSKSEQRKLNYIHTSTVAKQKEVKYDMSITHTVHMVDHPWKPIFLSFWIAFQSSRRLFQHLHILYIRTVRS